MRSIPSTRTDTKTDSSRLHARARRMLSLAASFAVLGASSAFAQVGSGDTENIETLRKQMNEMQQKYEVRIQAMEAKMQSMETRAMFSAPMTEANMAPSDGKGVMEKNPPLELPPLESFTRNFQFAAYVRAGVGFNGNGRGEVSTFVIPENYGGRMRLGNEPDTYMELKFIQKHLLGDDPSKMDVKFQVTPSIVNNTDKDSAVYTGNDGFDIGLREVFMEFKNVFKSAPDVTIWGGQRFYDRYDIHGNDYFFLDTSGYGVGAYNIDVGIGKLQIAYLGGIKDGVGDVHNEPDGLFQRYQANDGGPFYKQTLDVRLGDVDFLGGKLKFVFLANYQKGGDFIITDRSNDTVDGRAHIDDAWGLGGGAIYEYKFGTGSLLQFAALYGYGLTNIGAGVDLDKIGGAYASALALAGQPFGTFESIDPYNDSQRIRANVHWVWNPTDSFALEAWGVWQYDDQGYTGFSGSNLTGDLITTSGTTNTYGVGIRPVFWIADNLAIQGQAGFNYVDNVRSGVNTGDGGSFGIFTIAPTIKPKDPKNGGFFSRPELRIYATYAIWDDSLKGSIGGVNYADSNQGWTFGTQVEIWW